MMTRCCQLTDQPEVQVDYRRNAEAPVEVAVFVQLSPVEVIRSEPGIDHR